LRLDAIRQSAEKRRTAQDHMLSREKNDAYMGDKKFEKLADENQIVVSPA